MLRHGCQRKEIKSGKGKGEDVADDVWYYLSDRRGTFHLYPPRQKKKEKKERRSGLKTDKQTR